MAHNRLRVSPGDQLFGGLAVKTGKRLVPEPQNGTSLLAGERLGAHKDRGDLAELGLDLGGAGTTRKGVAMKARQPGKIFEGHMKPSRKPRGSQKALKRLSDLLKKGPSKCDFCAHN